MNQPVAIGAAIVAFVNSVISAVVLLDIAHLTDQQIAGINIVVLNLVILGTALYAHLKSTPVANPTLPSGTVVNVVTPPDQENHTTTV